MKLEALYGAIITKPVEVEETSYGSIIVPDLGNDTNKTAEVVAVGPGHYVMGQYIPTTIQVGDLVVLPTMGFTKFELDGEEYWIGKENEVLAKVIKDTAVTNE